MARHGTASRAVRLLGASVRRVRDDLFRLTRVQRRAALAGWRRVPAAQRREICRRAGQGLPAGDPGSSLIARRYGEYLLQRNRSNRLPRWALPLIGVLLLVGLSLMGLAVIGVPGGLVVTALGVVGWGQRRQAHLLVAANDPDRVSSGR